MAFLAVLLVVAVFVVWMIVHGRIRDLEKRLEEVSNRSATEVQLANLAHRVWELEREGAAAGQVERPPEGEHGQEPVAPPASSLFIPPPFVPPPLDPPAEASAAPVFKDPFAVPGPSLSERVRGKLGNEEWEALIGGSILNKAGAVVLVIGVALFLGYSFGHLTAAGRAALAMATSCFLLGGGIWVERRSHYKVFARGLIGAGWAALYATSYAIYAIPEARIIESPFAGSIVMLLVAAGMVGHSLLYRSQTVTAVAYFAAFAALAASPSSPFAVVSLIPLALSLLFLSTRFEWNYIPLFGLLATYGTCISRGSSDAPLALTQALFLAYWVVFEGFDLLRVKQRLTAGGMDWILPLNAIGFTGLSYLAWAHHSPERLWLAAAWAAGLFLGDSVVRAYLRPLSSFDPGESAVARLRYGSFEGSLIISAILAGLAIAGKVPGIWSSVGYALEAEILYLAGVRFGSNLIRGIGARGFVLSLARLAWSDSDGRKTEILGHATYNWTPPALLHVFLFYVNRAIRTPNQIFSSCAAGLLALVLAFELPYLSVGTAWLVFGLLLFEIGCRREARDFRLQGYVLSAAGVVATAILSRPWSHNDWHALSVSLVLAYVSALRSERMGNPGLDPVERSRFAAGASAASTLLAALLLWMVVPDGYLALSWCALAVLVIELGRQRLPTAIGWTFAPMQAAAITAVLTTNRGELYKFPPQTVLIMWFGSCVAAWLAAARLHFLAESQDAVVSDSGKPLLDRILRDGMIAWGTLAFLVGTWLALPNPYVAAGWMALCVAMIYLARRVPLLSLRIAALVTGLLTLIASLIENIDPPALAITAVVAAGFYAAQFLAKPLPQKWMPSYYSVQGTLLLCAMLYGRVSGGVLTVSWGVLGLGLLAAGFPLRERVLRLQALLLLLICILKLFIYDLRNLETIYRILSFVALGIILLAVSWIYTRFREQLKRLL